MAIFTSASNSGNLIILASEIGSLDGTIQLEFTDLDNDDNKILLKVSSRKLIHRGSAAAEAEILIPPRGTNTTGIRFDGWRLLGGSIGLGSTSSANTAAQRAVLVTSFGRFSTIPAGHTDSGRLAIHGVEGKITFTDQTSDVSATKTGQSAVGRNVTATDMAVEPGAVVFAAEGTIASPANMLNTVNIGVTVSSGTLRSGTGLATINNRRVKLDDIGFSYPLGANESIEVPGTSLLFTTS